MCLSTSRVLPRLCYSSYYLQITPSIHSVFWKAHHARVLQPSARFSPPLLRPPSLPSTAAPKTPTRMLSKKRKPMEHFSGKVPEVSAAVGTIHLRSDHPALGPISGFCLWRQQRAIQREDALARMRRLHPHIKPPPVSSRPLNQPSIPLPPPTPVRRIVKGIHMHGSPQLKPQVNGISTSTLRLNEATTPAISSPLRRAWGQNDIPSLQLLSNLCPKPPRTVAFVTEPICEATLLKRSTFPISTEPRQSGEDHQASGKEARS